MKILIADDDPISSKLLKTLLFMWGHDVVTVADGNEAWNLLQQDDGLQMAILDWMMPGLDGLALCRRLREHEKKNGDRYTYVIMVTGKADQEDIVAGIGAGADEYIVKPFDNKEFQARLHTGQRIIELQTALRVANKKLLFLSRLDPLTGALTRNAVLDDLDLGFYRARRENRPLSISRVDIANLQSLNQRYGDGTGDYIRQECVRRINHSVRRTDSFGRLDEDCFLIVLPGVDDQTGKVVCRRIENALCGKEIRFREHRFSLAVRQGLAVWDGKASSEELLAAAENLLAAKVH